MTNGKRAAFMRALNRYTVWTYEEAFAGAGDPDLMDEKREEWARQRDLLVATYDRHTTVPEEPPEHVLEAMTAALCRHTNGDSCDCAPGTCSSFPPSAEASAMYHAMRKALT